MRNIELTDEEFKWVSVAIEGAKTRAEQIASFPVKDEEDAESAMDANYLVTVWEDLQEKFPPTEIGLAPDA